jgi:hypothetical protein
MDGRHFAMIATCTVTAKQATAYCYWTNVSLFFVFMLFSIELISRTRKWSLGYDGKLIYAIFISASIVSALYFFDLCHWRISCYALSLLVSASGLLFSFPALCVQISRDRRGYRPNGTRRYITLVVVVIVFAFQLYYHLETDGLV